MHRSHLVPLVCGSVLEQPWVPTSFAAPHDRGTELASAARQTCFYSFKLSREIALSRCLHCILTYSAEFLSDLL